MCPKRLSLLNQAFDKLDLKSQDNFIDIEDIKYWFLNNSKCLNISSKRLNEVRNYIQFKNM